MTNDRFPTRPDDPAFVSGGITVREYFAAMAMQGLLSSETGDCHYADRTERVYDDDGKPKWDEHGEPIYKVVKTAEQLLAEDAVKQAEALIEELNKEAE